MTRIAFLGTPAVAVPVLRHRLGLNFQAQTSGLDTVQLTNMLLKAVPEPKLA